MAQMEMSEEMKQYISLAQSLSLEAQKLSENFELDKQTAMQHMGTLLASNCQKICIGPSFHLYSPEKKDMNPPQQVLHHDDDDADDEEYETIIYNGPNVQYQSLECSPNLSTDKMAPKGKETTDAALVPMNVRLAQASACYGGLLSPSFFCGSPGSSSSSSLRDGGYSSQVSSASSDLKSSDASGEILLEKQPFRFPKVSNLTKTPQMGYDCNSPHALERVEILGDVVSGSDETDWLEWPKQYIEEGGFRLGVQPGDFYKSKSGPMFYVKMPHRSKYEIIVTNRNQVQCDVDLYVNGKPAFELRLQAGDSRLIGGPSYSNLAFTCFRSKDVPPDLGVKEGDPQHGMVKVDFTPEKVGSARLRAASEPLRKGSPVKDILDIFKDSKEKKKERSFTTSDKDKVVRSFDMNSVVEAVTLLQGEKKQQNLVRVADIETDLSKRVTLQFRIIASLTEEVEASHEKIYCLEPPPIASRR